MNNDQIQALTAGEIEKSWKEVERQHPGIRIREAAAHLGLGEAQLLATGIGNGVIRLNNNWEELMKRLPELGRVMSLTRNDTCILEHKGTFDEVNVMGGAAHRMATVIGPIETRVFFSGWHVAFAAKTQKGERVLTSLQVFDQQGAAVTKIYLQEDSNFEAYEQLVKDFTSEDQRREQATEPYKQLQFADNPDVDGFLEGWNNLQDTHDFFPLMRKFKINRYDAIKFANGRFTYPINLDVLQGMLENAAKQKLPIMIFAGNKGNIQIHQDKVRTIRMMETGHSGAQRWLNVLDPDFNMHLRMDLLEDAWVVRKPTSDGEVTSIECFDKQGELAVQFFGLRKPGKPELDEWKSMVSSLGDASVVV